jgi:hypothetical protein
MKYLSPSYLSAMTGLFNEKPTPRKRFTSHDDHTSKVELKNKKIKRKQTKQARKTNRRK